MGARQSLQSDFDRRPRSNSSIETGIEVHGGGSNRRQIINYHRDISSTASDLDEEAEEVTSGLANLGLSFSNGLFSTPASSSTLTNPSQNTRHNVYGSTPHNNSTTSNSHHSSSRYGNHNNSHQNSSGLRYSFRPTNRTSFLHALSASIGSGDSSNSPSTSNSNRNSRDRNSTPVLHFLGRDIKCPVCNKKVPSDDVEVHLVMCFTRPKIDYNDYILDSDKGECAICLDEMCSGETIARLPCLCIYHKSCIDEWFKRKNACPEHPSEET